MNDDLGILVCSQPAERLAALAIQILYKDEWIDASLWRFLDDDATKYGDFFLEYGYEWIRKMDEKWNING